MPNKPKSLADYIAATTSFINKAAYQAGQFIYGINQPRKSDLSLEKQPLKETKTEDETVQGNQDNQANPEATETPAETEDTSETLSELDEPIIPPKEEEPFSQELLDIEYELKALRYNYGQAQDDIDRNALHFKILRLERAQQNYLAKRATSLGF